MAFARRQGSAPIYRTKAHRQARAALLKAYQPGDPCCLCGEEMWPPTSQLHADHQPGTNQYRGLAHAECNIRDAARRARALQNDETTDLQW